MPDRITYPRGTSPTKWDRFRAHSSEVWVAGGSLFVGLFLLGAAIVDTFNPSPALADAPWFIHLGISVFLTFGALGWLRTTFTWFETPDGYWTRYQLATGFTGLGWLAYTLSAFFSFPSWTIPWQAGLVFSGISFTKMLFSVQHQQETLERATSGKNPLCRKSLLAREKGTKGEGGSEDDA